MSWWVSLSKDGKLVKVESHVEGATYCLEGSDGADLNITYNYSPHYYNSLDKRKGLEWLDGKKAKEALARLERAIKELGTEKDNDYWKSTPGNAGYALLILLKWAKQYPEAIFEVN